MNYHGYSTAQKEGCHSTTNFQSCISYSYNNQFTLCNSVINVQSSTPSLNNSWLYFTKQGINVIQNCHYFQYQKSQSGLDSIQTGHLIFQPGQVLVQAGLNPIQTWSPKVQELKIFYCPKFKYTKGNFIVMSFLKNNYSFDFNHVFCKKKLMRLDKHISRLDWNQSNLVFKVWTGF